jgi:hypothetical protein
MSRALEVLQLISHSEKEPSMLILFQPVLTALIGAVLSVFGLFHTVTQLPAPVVWQHVVSLSPQLLVLFVFLGCLVIAVTGLAMLWTGLQGVRQRVWQLRRLRWQSSPGYDEPHESQMRW